MKRLFLLAFLLAAPSALAQETRIAAVVNDDVISMADVTARLQLVFASSNLQDTPQTRQRVTRQVLRVLIDEKLQMQEAKHLSISVSDTEIDQALANIEAQNNLVKGGLGQLLASRGVDRGTLVDQITASIAWSKVLRQNVYRITPVSDEEIEAALAKQRETADQPRARVAEIFLQVDSPQQDDDVHRFADRLFEQLREGASFAELARQFSQSATAAVGGDIGWVVPSQLPSELGQAVQRLNPGEMAPPVRSTGGFYLVVVLEKRAGGSKAEDDTRVSLSQVMFPLAPDALPAQRDKVMAQAEAISKSAKSCGELAQLGRQQSPQNSGDLGKLRVGDLPADVRKTVLALKVAEASAPVPLRGGIGVLMVCERDDSPDGAASRDQIAEELTRDRMDGLARRYLRDLRRVAYVDLRG